MPSALLAGATGLVGGHLLRLLLEHPRYERVTALVRRGLPVSHRKLLQREVSFDQLAELGSVPRADDVFCCLGTTMSKAGSREAFRRVDYTYVVELARLASEQHARQFLLVSALGADPASRVFYQRVKGEAEEAVRHLRFSAVHIFRPSLLVGRRNEFRPAERVGIAVARLISPVLVGSLRRYRPIDAATVARAMIRVALDGSRGVHVFGSDRIQELGVES
ncbi:MAG TPA: oxidoreductase [Gemmatimonadales bacterium]|nr:oxidoreductase [Gemmatimonadales bacterium]